ncbi:MAG: hypothetical protein IKQ95_01495 [Synergistaceae bacterium]|nr:hypothetical protein [Synergistaceae bacterium]
MKEYITPSVTGGAEGGFAFPAALIAGVTMAKVAAAFAGGVAAALLTSKSGDKSVAGGLPALEPCLD